MWATDPALLSDCNLTGDNPVSGAIATAYTCCFNIGAANSYSIAASLNMLAAHGSQAYIGWGRLSNYIDKYTIDVAFNQPYVAIPLCTGIVHHY